MPSAGHSGRTFPALVLAAALCAAMAPAAAATSLREVVRYALASDPSIVASRAEREAAGYDIERARAKHLPTVDVAGSRRVTGDTSNRLGPRVNLNLWASGAIDAEIERETWREQSLASRVTAQRETVAFETLSAWFRLLAARDLLAAARANFERHAALVEDFRQIVRIDRGRRFDLVQASARLEQIRFLVAEGEAELAQAREALARWYPLPVDPSDMAAPPVLSEPAVLNPARLEALIDQHPAVLAAARDLRSARANLEVASASRGPRLDLEARSGADSFSQVTLSWPAFDPAARAGEASAAASLTGAEATVETERRLVTERLRSADQAWRTARQRADIAAGQIRIAEQLVEVYREQFGIGRRNLLDLLNAYAELASAESAAVRSRLEAAQARYRIEFAMGRLTLLFQAGS
jgi:adhesin transport system outer membrane protein